MRSANRLSRWRVVTAALILVVLFSGLLGFNLYDDYRRDVRQARDQSTHLAGLIEAHTRLLFGELDHDLKMLANDVRALSTTSGISAEQFEALGRRHLSSLKAVGITWIRPADGAQGDDAVQVLGTVMAAPGTAKSLDVYTAHLDAARGFYVGNPRTDATTGIWFLPVSRRVEAGDGRFLGVLVASVPEPAVRQFYQHLPVGPRGSAMLLRDDGVVLAQHPYNAQLVGKPTAKGPLFAVHVPKRAVGDFRAKSILDGVDRFVAYRKLADLPFVAVAAIAADDAFTDYAGALWPIVAAWLLLVVAALAGLFVFSRMEGTRSVADAARAAARAKADQVARHLQTVQDSLTQAVLTFDAAGRIESANGGAERLLGLSRQELIGRSVMSYVRMGEGSNETQLDALKSATSAREATCLTRDRQAMPVELRAARVATDGEPRYVVSLTDTTERQEAARQLQIKDTRFRAIFDSATQGMTLLRPDGIVLEANAALLERTGIPRNLLVGKPAWDAPWWRLVPDGGAWVREAARKAAAGLPVSHVFAAVDRTGKKVHVDYSMKPIRNPDGEVTYLLVEARDVTDHISAGAARGTAAD
ncbi:MAG TPA: PAS domain S-box protein [Vineibacter sp.]|nr:PAS domain S-box protein [Vineibacter sp.]